ncbi:hypothetical protein ACWDCZ_38965, partial [Kitasatospora sp. NPDC001225]
PMYVIGCTMTAGAAGGGWFVIRDGKPNLVGACGCTAPPRPTPVGAPSTTGPWPSSPPAPASSPPASYGPPPSPPRACVALTDLLHRTGLVGEADVKPASITTRAAVEAFEASGRIEDAARCLGLRSLDRAATVIHLTWRPDPTDREEASGA